MLGQLLAQRPVRMSIDQDEGTRYFIAESDLLWSRNKLIQKIEELVDDPDPATFYCCITVEDSSERHTRSPYAITLTMADEVPGR